MAPNTNEVIDTLHSTLESIETEESDLAGGVRAVVPDSEIGRVMGALRRNGFEFESKRDPSGENLVVNIEADGNSDEEERGLGNLFR